MSVRADQCTEAVRAGFPQIVDALEDIGPIAGIAAAQAAHPQAAWLVLACDLPFVDDDVLARLIAARRAGQPVTAYRSTSDGLPEPLCSDLRARVRRAGTRGDRHGTELPRKLVIASGVPLLEQIAPLLGNVNTPEDLAAAHRQLATGSLHEIDRSPLLRDPARPGRTPPERVETGAATAAELFDELAARHGLALAREAMRVAINDEFGDWQHSLQSGDRVVFIPPVAGG